MADTGINARIHLRAHIRALSSCPKRYNEAVTWKWLKCYGRGVRLEAMSSWIERDRLAQVRGSGRFSR
jgi:hypothetical protein